MDAQSVIWLVTRQSVGGVAADVVLAADIICVITGNVKNTL